MTLVRNIRVLCKQSTLIPEPDYGWANSARKNQSNKWSEFRRTQRVAKQLIHKQKKQEQSKNKLHAEKPEQIEEIIQDEEDDQQDVPKIEDEINEDGIKGRMERILKQQIKVGNLKPSNVVQKDGIGKYIFDVLNACLSPEEVIATCELLWPQWAQQEFYLLNQGTGQEVAAPKPQEAAFALMRIAKLLKKKYHSFSPSLARSGCVRGLIEALRVTKARLVWDGTNEHLIPDMNNTEEDDNDEDDPQSLFYDPQYDAVKPLFEPVDVPARWVLESLGWQWTSAAVWAIGSLAGPLFYAAEMEALMMGLKFLNGQVSSHQANRMLIGLSKGRHYSSWLSKLASKSVIHFSQSKKNLSQDFVGNVMALAQLGHCPTQLKKFLAQNNNVRQFNSEQLALLAWSLAVLNEVESQTFKNLWGEICSRGLEGMKPKKWQLCQIYQTALSIQLEATTFTADSLNWTDSAGQLLQSAEKAWIAEGNDLEKKRESYYQRSIANTLSTMGLFHVKEDVSSGYAIDLTLPEYKIAIEAEGPHHLSRTDLRLLGPTLFKHRLLKKLGWRLVSVAYHEWDALFDNQEQREYLGGRMSEVMEPDEKRQW